MDNSQLYHQWFGIPFKDQPPNAYRLLGVERFESDPAVIEAAAEQRMLLLRARQNGSHSAQTQQMMNEVSRAMNILLDDSKRAAYDDELRQRMAGQNGNGHVNAPAEQIPAGQSEETAPAPAPITLRTDAVPAFRQRRRQSPSLVLLWVGLGSGVAIALIVLMALLVSNRTTDTKVAEMPPDKTPHKTLRPTTAAPRAKPDAKSQAATGEFQFEPREQPLEAEEPIPEEAETVGLVQPEPIESPEPAAAEAPAEPAAEEPVEAAASPPPNAGEKQVLRPEDLRFIGAFKLPQQACGQSTGYAAGCLALRHVNKRPRLFSDSHVSTGGAVYEVELPALAKMPPYATAEIAREWGDIYQGHKHKANGESYNLDGETPTTGLRWDEPKQRLWWVYGQKYNTENQDAPTFGATRFKDDKLTAEGPWKLKLTQSWQRGGTLEIPASFADKYTGGKRLGVGFGGYYSIFEGGSYGPTLSAAEEPQEGKSPAFVTLLAYPMEHPCVRDANYKHVSEGWMGMNPVDGRGTWNATDEIGGELFSGGAVWIDAADKHGLLFFASLGTGRIAYENGGVQCAGRENALFIYDPTELVKVAQGKAKPWTPTPKFYPFKNPADGMEGRPAGVAYDAAARRLYVVFINAYVDGEEAYPLVVVYQI